MRSNHPSRAGSARGAVAVLCALAVAAGCQARQSGTPAGLAPAEEVNVGYGTQKRENVTGSVASLTEEDLGRTQGASMERLLRGRIPGLQITRSAGGEASVWIRGVGPSRDRRPPHVVIDGASSSARDLLALSPDVVARIDVLKDAAASVYGLRGANGVILVTTKRTR